MRFLSTILASLVMLTALTRAEDSPTEVLERLKEAMPECGVSTTLSASTSLHAKQDQLQCLMEHVPKSTCALTDTSCICTNASLNQEIGVCVSGGCTIPDALRKY